MPPQPTSADLWPEEIVPPKGVLVARGYGVRVSTWNGRLRVQDGIGSDRRSVLLHRATSRLERLIVIGHSGAISLEALAMLAAMRAAFVQVDADGLVVAANGPQGTDRPSLRRAQAKALGSLDGLAISRNLVGEKIAGQRANLEILAACVEVAPDVLEAIDHHARAATHAENSDDLRTCEGRAAAAYWSAWSRLPVMFARRDQARIPAHWRTFGTRSSALTGGPRLAVNPANAMASYMYAILETETTIACRIVGLDPGLGIFHVDQDNRESLAADLMEPLRPVVDRYLMGMLQRRTFAASDFFETSTGVCRLTSTLARSLWPIAPELGQLAGRIAEDVAAQLEGAKVRTPVTGRRRQAARPFGRLRNQSTELTPPTHRGCLWCGIVVGRDRRICDTCAPAERAQRNAKFSAAGPRALAKLRGIGADPTKTAQAIEKVRQSRIRRRQEQVAWEKAHPSGADPDHYRAKVLPQIQDKSIRRLAAATGLSMKYCAEVRIGKRVPHPMWWRVLEGISRA
jgi:CRISPR-associated endonuclease Cas1